MADEVGPRFGPAGGGVVRQLVVLLHGLGADGHDLIDLAPYWSKALPDAAFLAPHAPEPFAMGGHGRQWFALGNFDLTAIGAGMRRASAVLDRILDAELARLGLAADAYALMGFSQGAMTALFNGMRRRVPPRAILAYSGGLIEPQMLAAEMTGKPPVLLVHGEDDQVVPVSRSRDAETILKHNMVPVEAIYVKKLAHGIDDAGLSAGALWLQRAFATGVVT